jgi:hypothetical protein
MNSIQTLYDVLYAFAVVVGISAAFALAFGTAAAMHRRSQVSTAKVAPRSAIPAQRPTRLDDRELVLR